MALTECGECGQQISKNAKNCPKCGAPPKKKTSLFTWLVLIGIVVVAVNYETPTAIDTSSDPSPRTVAMDNVSLEFSWQKGGFDNVMLATFVIKNDSAHTVKDIGVRCTQFAKSGAALNTNRKTIYDVVPAKSAKTFKDFNMGLIHAQSDSTSCLIYDLTL